MDKKHMEMALELAIRGKGKVNPNPLVGAVVVKNGRIIGKGWHGYYGGPHAEVEAIRDCNESIEGATMYVNMEPCSHYGKTPPCVKAIIEAGIKHVVIGMEDPNPMVAGKGIEFLKLNGVRVARNIMHDEAIKLNEMFVRHVSTGLPFCTMKTAMTMDGKIATATGSSKWITGSESRNRVQQLRFDHTAILVGVGTVVKDDPRLTLRAEEKRGNPYIRIIVDSRLRIPIESGVLHQEKNDGMRTIILTTENCSKEKKRKIEELGVEIVVIENFNGRVDLKKAFKVIGEMGIDSVLLEGGAELNYSALSSGLVDKVVAFIAPKIFGGREAKTPVGGDGITDIKRSIRLSNPSVKIFGSDICLESYVEKEEAEKTCSLES
jgi:diaminohydroxyphosphoribosylaminopyrimidine deaminase/5-amino-6-(5-phosphoribosylamino)uracil reductase